MVWKWKPNKTQSDYYKEKMKELEEFLREHGEIGRSISLESFYFTINGTSYRVSNHSPEKSNEGAFGPDGVQWRDLYHPFGREPGVVYIRASKIRLVEIYNDLLEGYELDGRGKRKNADKSKSIEGSLQSEVKEENLQT